MCQMAESGVSLVRAKAVICGEHDVCGRESHRRPACTSCYSKGVPLLCIRSQDLDILLAFKG